LSFGSGSLKRRSWEGSKQQQPQSEESVEKKEEPVASPRKAMAPQPTPIQRISSKSSFKEIIIETENEEKEEPKKKEKEKEKDNIFSRKLKNLKKGTHKCHFLIFSVTFVFIFR
jgi:hypothetical protein